MFTLPQMPITRVRVRVRVCVCSRRPLVIVKRRTNKRDRPRPPRPDTQRESEQKPSTVDTKVVHGQAGRQPAAPNLKLKCIDVCDFHMCVCAPQWRPLPCLAVHALTL